MHSNLPDSGLTAIGADSIEHGRALGHSELEALGARGGAWTPTLCAMLANRDLPILRFANRWASCASVSVPPSVCRGPRSAGVARHDVVGTIADEITLLADHGLTAGQAIAAAGHSRETSSAFTRRVTS